MSDKFSLNINNEIYIYIISVNGAFSSSFFGESRNFLLMQIVYYYTCNKYIINIFPIYLKEKIV